MKRIMKVTVLHDDPHHVPSRAWTELRDLERKAPRYASYPASDRFVEAFGAANYHRWLERRRLSGGGPLSVYVHLPFCMAICHHCARDRSVCHSRARGREYLRLLRREIDIVTAELGGEQQVARMFWGGCGPNWYHADELAELAATIHDAFRIYPGGDHAIAIDPRQIEPGLLERLVQVGFNRLAVNVPELDPAVQRAIRWQQAPEQTAGFIAQARAAGFRSIGVELMCGLPGQRAPNFARTLEQIIAMAPSRITLYDYDHQPSRNRNQRHIRASELPPLPELTAMYSRAHEHLAAADYQFIGMGHFARPDDPLARAQRAGHLDRDCLGYSTQPEADVVGFGAGAISRVGASYSQNLRLADDYAAAMRQGVLPVARGVELDADDLVRRAVIHGLCGGGRVAVESIEIAHLIDFHKYFAAEIRTLQPWIEAGLLEIDAEWIVVTSPGRRYLRAISACFDRYQRESERRANVDPIL